MHREGYWKEYYAANKDRINKRSRAWARENRQRANALQTVRYHRKKTQLHAGGLKTILELLAKYPKRRIVI